MVLVVWVLSFSGTGSSLRQARGSMRQHLPALIRASQQRRLLIARHGLTFAWWRVTADGWLLEEICSYPRGRGHGTQLLREFLHLANQAQVAVVLVYPPERVNWYRRHGFRLAPPEPAVTRLGLVVLRRSLRRPAAPRRRYPATQIKTNRAVHRDRKDAAARLRR